MLGSLQMFVLSLHKLVEITVTVCVCQSSHTEESYTCAKEGFFFLLKVQCVEFSGI